MSKAKISSRLREDFEEQLAEGVLLSTVERRLIRAGHPEKAVQQLVEAERAEAKEKDKREGTRQALGTGRMLGLALVVAGIFLPWSSVAQGDFGFGTSSTDVLNGMAGNYLIYGLGFLGACVLLVVVMLFVRSNHEGPPTTRDRVVFGLVTLVEALMGGWWVMALVAVNKVLAEAQANFEEINALLGDVSGLADDLGSQANMGLGLFLIPVGVVIMLIVGYLEIPASGGDTRLPFRKGE